MSKLQYLTIAVGKSFEIKAGTKPLLSVRADCRYWSAVLGRQFECETLVNGNIEVLRLKNISKAAPLITATQIEIYIAKENNIIDNN